MGVHLGVATAFFAAGCTGASACFNQCLQHLGIAPCPADRRTPRCQADIGTILIQPDTLAQIGNHIFRKACISAGDTGLRTFETRFDAGNQCRR
jgi:hypothetical protein